MSGLPRINKLENKAKSQRLQAGSIELSACDELGMLMMDELKKRAGFPTL